MSAPLPPPGEPPRRKVDGRKLAGGIVGSLPLTMTLSSFGFEVARSNEQAVAYVANVVVLAVFGLYCLLRSEKWRSFGLGLLIGWALQVLITGACIALLAQAEFG